MAKKKKSTYSDAIGAPVESTPAPTALETAQAKLDGMTYESPYGDQIDRLLGDILGRGPFSYDMSADPMYQQTKDSYVAGGRAAMADAMGQAAAMTGGYGSSYAATAGSQAYQNYLNGLNDAALDLYDRAYQAYENKGNQMLSNLNLLRGREDAAYNRYRDERADAQSSRDYAYQREQDDQAQRNWQAQFDFSTRKARKWRREHPEYLRGV